MIVDKPETPKRIPLAEQKRLRDSRIRAMYSKGISLDEICNVLHVSKTTAFFAVNSKEKKSK